MGMFDRDKLYGGDRLDEFVKVGAQQGEGDLCVLFDCGIVGTISTDIGIATKSQLILAKVNNPTDVRKVGTLSSPIGEKVREKDDGDLPAVVEFFMVEASKKEYNDALVMQFVEPWTGEVPSDRPALDTTRVGEAARIGAETDVPPFD